MMFPVPVDVNWSVFSPALVLLVVASFCLIYALFQKDSRSVAGVSFMGLVFSFVLNFDLFTTVTITGDIASSFGLRFIADQPALAFNFLILIGTAFAMLISFDYLQRTELDHPEYYPLLLLSACGAMIMASAGDFITLVLGLEIMSLAVYVLAAWRQDARESEEAGMKYFLLGAFASAFLIYGVALMYGATGQFVYDSMYQAFVASGFDKGLYATLGALMILGGLGFKVAFAPFHQWAPDVYTGAPTPVTAFMSVVVKVAAFAALLRIFATLVPVLPDMITQTLVVLVGLTVVVGNLAALMQRGVKRMLAYSAVAHAGYLGLAVLAADTVGMQAAIWYLTAYAFMNAGAFAILTLLSDKNDHGDDIERFAGLGRTRPYLAAAMTVFLLSLAGIPLLAGFVGKILVFQAAISAGYIGLAVLGIITSIVAVVYYVRPVMMMYFRDAEYETPAYRSLATNIAIGVAVFMTLLLGIFPGWWYGLLGVSQRIIAGH